MLSTGRETATGSSPASCDPAGGIGACPAGNTATGNREQSRESLVSPSIHANGESIPAFELKFLLPETVARRVELWADAHMLRDSFCDLKLGGSYQTTTLYLDTPQMDVFNRAPGFGGRKFRLRRYGHEAKIYLERKSRNGDRVSKRRSDLPMHELNGLHMNGVPADWPGHWFREPIESQMLRPACRISYQRTAFMQSSPSGVLRVTLDRSICGEATKDWDLTPVAHKREILPDEVICEFKFRDVMPDMFKQAIVGLQLQLAAISKYRRVMSQAVGIADGGRLNG